MPLWDRQTSWPEAEQMSFRQVENVVVIVDDQDFAHPQVSEENACEGWTFYSDRERAFSRTSSRKRWPGGFRRFATGDWPQLLYVASVQIRSEFKGENLDYALVRRICDVLGAELAVVRGEAADVDHRQRLGFIPTAPTFCVCN